MKWCYLCMLLIQGYISQSLSAKQLREFIFETSIDLLELINTYNAKWHFKMPPMKKYSQSCFAYINRQAYVMSRLRFKPVNSPHKGQWRGALMFSLICVWINGWVNNPSDPITSFSITRYGGPVTAQWMIWVWYNKSATLWWSSDSAVDDMGMI